MDRPKTKLVRQNGSPPKRSRRFLRNDSPEDDRVSTSLSDDAGRRRNRPILPVAGDASVEVNNPNQYLKRFTRNEVAQHLLFDSSGGSELEDENEAESDQNAGGRNAKSGKKRASSRAELMRTRARHLPMKTRSQLYAEKRAGEKRDVPDKSEISRSRCSVNHGGLAREENLKRLTRSKIALAGMAPEKADSVYRRRYAVNETANSNVSGKSTTKTSKRGTAGPDAGIEHSRVGKTRAHRKKTDALARKNAEPLGFENESTASDAGSAQGPEQRRSPRRKRQQVVGTVRPDTLGKNRQANCDINRALLDLSLEDNAKAEDEGTGEGDDDAAIEERSAIAGDTSGHLLGTDGGGDLLPLAQANKRTNKKRGKNSKAAVAVRPNRADVISRLAVARVEDYRSMGANEDETDGQSSWEDRTEQIFTELHLLLLHNYNVLLKGIGSKRNLLNRFARSDKMKDEHHVVVQGFSPSFSMAKLLKTVMQVARMPDSQIRSGLRALNNNTSRTDKGADEAFANLDKYLSRSLSGDLLFIILHNIDGPVLRHIRSQRLLARLSRLDSVRLLTSYDFDDVGLLWPLDVLMLFDWVEYPCNTFEQYTFELQFDRGQQRREADERRLSALHAVFSSMTLNSKRIFLIAAKYQLQEAADAEGFDQNSPIIGMPYDELRETCLAEMLSSSDSALRHQLSEYEDHKLMRIKRGFDGSEILEILVPREALKQFYAEQPDELKVLL